MFHYILPGRKKGNLCLLGVWITFSLPDQRSKVLLHFEWPPVRTRVWQELVHWGLSDKVWIDVAGQQAGGVVESPPHLLAVGMQNGETDNGLNPAEWWCWNSRSGTGGRCGRWRTSVSHPDSGNVMFCSTWTYSMSASGGNCSLCHKLNKYQYLLTWNQDHLC